MIFKTFDNNDGIASKIGILNRSFSEITKAYEKAKEVTSKDNGQSFLKNFVDNLKIDVNEVSDLYKKLIVTQKDIEPFLKSIDVYDGFDDNKAQEVLSTLQKTKEKVDANETSWEEYYKTLKNKPGMEWQTQFVQTMDLTKASVDDVKEAQAAARQAAVSYNKDLGKLTIGAKATDIALKGLALAGSMAAMYLVSSAVSFAIKKYKEFFPTVEESRKALNDSKEALEDQNKKVDELSKSLDEAESKLRELKSLNGVGETISDEELKKQEQYTNELREQLTIERERQAIEAKKTLKKAEKAYNNYDQKYDSNGADVNNGTFAGNENFIQKSADIEEELRNTIKAYNIQKDNYDHITSELADLEGKTDSASVKKFNSLTKQQESISKQMTNIRETALNLHDDIKMEHDALADIQASGESLSEKDLGILSKTQSGLNVYDQFVNNIAAASQAEIDANTKKLEIAKENLQNEYEKIHQLGLEDYEDKIKNGTVQSKFGNVDMDNRTIIKYDEKYLEDHADILKGWAAKYDEAGNIVETKYDEVANVIKNGEEMIDTVWGQSDRFGENLKDGGWEVAFTPILPDGTFLSKDAVYDYIETILQEAYENDGKVTESELESIDAQGRQIGDTFIKGIFAGIDDSEEYENNGNWAEVVGRLMHFSGDYGAVALAKKEIKDLGGETDSINQKSFNIADEQTTKKIDDFQTKLNTLGTAIQNLRDKKLSDSDLLDLQQQFPTLINRTDDLDVALEELVNSALKDMIDTFEEAGAPSNLIESFKELANQAKGLNSIDWSGTFNVFDQADSKMQSLAEFTKALGSSYTITATEARKFADVFPELLQLGQVTSNGLIQFNKDVVENFINGKQAQINADRDTQIAQLESEKALLEGKRATAMAALQLVAAQKSGEIDGENQANEKIAEARDNLVQHLMDLGVEEQNADAAAKELMAGNTQEYDRVVADVSDSVDTNLTGSINDAAKNVNKQAQNMINSLFGVSKQAESTDKTVGQIGTGSATAVKENLNGIEESVKKFNQSNTVADFKKAVADTVSVDKYQGVDTAVKLMLDINDYSSAIGDIDSQINLLKSAGNKNVQDYLKELNDKSGKGSGGDKGAKDNSTIDWISRSADLLERESKRLETALQDTWTAYTGLSEEDIERVQELFNMPLSPDSKEVDELMDYASKLGISIGELQKLSENGGLESRQSILTQKIDADQKSLDQAKESLDYYKQSYEEYVSKVPEYRDKIENGGTDIESFTSDQKAQIDKAIQAFDSWKDSEEKVKELQKTIRDEKGTYYDNIVDGATKENEKLADANDLIQKQIDLLNTQGSIVSADMYEEMMSNTEDQIDTYQQILQARQDELADSMERGLEPGTEEWYKLVSAVMEAKGNIKDLEKEQANLEKQLRELPVTNLEKLGNIYQSILDTIQNWGAEMEASGKTLNVDYYQKLINNANTSISNYKEEIEAIQDVIEDYTPGTDNWNEMNDKLQQCNSSISSLVQNMHKWNEELLKLPIQKISDASDSLSKIVDGLNDVKSEHETVISAVTGAISDEIDRLNDEKEAYEDTINDQKEALQDRMDLLDKQNEKLKLQAQYEQALYDLSTVTTQHIDKVVREGEITYESNADNLRNAEESVQDALAALKKQELQDQMDALDDALDDYNDKLQDTLDSLQKISDKWSEIASKKEQQVNETTATDILGKGWKDKVLSGNDADIFQMFSKLYSDNVDQINKYQEQIDSTEHISSLIQEYIDSYKAGTLTYEEAQAGIHDLVSQMNQKMSAMDNLQNIYNYMGKVYDTAADGDAVFGGIQKAFKESGDQLISSLQQYQANAGLISESMSSWQQLTNNVESIKDILEDVKDNLKDTERDSDSKKDKDDNVRGSGNSRATGKHSSKSVYGSSGFSAEKHHSGVFSGAVGSSSADKTDKIKVLEAEKLEPNEVPALLERGEMVFTPEQMEKLVASFSATAYVPDNSWIKNMYPSATVNTKPNIVNVSVGDVKLTDVRDVDGFAKAMGRDFVPLARQALARF